MIAVHLAPVRWLAYLVRLSGNLVLLPDNIHIKIHLCHLVNFHLAGIPCPCAQPGPKRHDFLPEVRIFLHILKCPLVQGDIAPQRIDEFLFIVLVHPAAHPEINIRVDRQKLIPKHPGKKSNVICRFQLARVVIVANDPVAAVRQFRVNGIILFECGVCLRIVAGPSAFPRRIGHGGVRPAEAGKLCAPHPEREFHVEGMCRVRQHAELLMYCLIAVSPCPCRTHIRGLNPRKAAEMQHFHILVKLIPGIIQNVVLQAHSLILIYPSGKFHIPEGNDCLSLLYPRFPGRHIGRHINLPGNTADMGIRFPCIHPAQIKI